MVSSTKQSKTMGWFILLSSSTTLLCCALPILLVSLGMGAVVASLYGEYLPWLRWFGLHEVTTFAVTASILLIAAWSLYRPGRACPTDPNIAQQCQTANRWNIKVFWGSLLIWCIGAFSAFVLPLLV